MMMQAAPSLMKYPMVEKLILDLRWEAHRQGQGVGDRLTTDDAISEIRDRYTKLGPYPFCQTFGLLVNNSAEEFAIQWMSFYNELYPGTY